MMQRGFLFISVLVVMCGLSTQMTGCGGGIPLISSGPEGTYEYRAGSRRTVIDLDPNGSGKLHMIVSKSSGANTREILWSDIGGGQINLHASLGKGQRAAVPFQSLKKRDGGLEVINSETKQGTGQVYRRVAFVTGI